MAGELFLPRRLFLLFFHGEAESVHSKRLQLLPAHLPQNGISGLWTRYAGTTGMNGNTPAPLPGFCCM